MVTNVGKNISRKLLQQNKSAKDLAEYAEVSDAYISMLCNGKREGNKIALCTAFKIAEFLNCSVYDLISPPAEEVASGSARYGLV